MENNKDARTFKDLGQAKNYLENRFKSEVDAVADSVNPELRPKFDQFAEQAKTKIGELRDVQSDVTKEQLYSTFLGIVYSNSEFHKELLSSISRDLEKELSEVEPSFGIVKTVSKLDYVNRGSLKRDLMDSGKIIASKDVLKEILEIAFSDESDVDESLANLLDVARNYINNGDWDSKSFVLLTKHGDNKLGFGVYVGPDGNLVNVGICDIQEACRNLSFDKTYDKLNFMSENIKLLPVINDFKDYPESNNKPYSLPNDLFLLKSTCGTYWIPLHLENTIVGREIENKLSKSSAPQI